MTGADFIALLPMLVLAGGATVLMLQIAFYRNIALSTLLTIAILALATLAIVPAAPSTARAVTPLLQVDGYALLFTALFCLGALVTTVLSVDYLRDRGDEPEEFFLLLVLSTLGAVVLAYATHLASLLLGMELLGVALYALIAYPDRGNLPLEAATKYLVLSGTASATLLFGFALLYAATGALGFAELGQQLQAGASQGTLPMAGAAMITAGLAFKLSLAPFHMWTPDVYEGAPSPVAGYLASVAKAAVFVVLLRFFLDAQLFDFPVLLRCIGLMAVLSMLLGNLLALQQNNIKRMLAYSSIAHMGYLAVILIAAGQPGNRALAVEAATYYLVAYTATTLAAFGLLAVISSQTADEEHAQLSGISGLFWHQPMLALMMTVALLSLAGIPLTAGFIAKFYIFTSAVAGLHWILLGALVIGSALGIYYYLRAVYYMTRRIEEHNNRFDIDHAGRVRALSCVLILAILLLGVLPQPLMNYIQSIL